MICPKCNGRGTVGYYHIDHFVDIECDRCNGSGEVSEVPMTNEEYLKSCTTEQLATFLAIVQYDGTDLTLKKNHVEKWVEWLKQPHTPKE